jgi:hypothetical protein
MKFFLHDAAGTELDQAAAYYSRADSDSASSPPKRFIE